MPIFEGAGPINYSEFLREQKGLNDKVMRLQWEKLVREVSHPKAPAETRTNDTDYGRGLDKEQFE
jgi:hypothetical protein